MTLRHALLGAALALPLALLALATPAEVRLSTVLAALPLLGGLLVLDVVLRARVPEGTAFWTLVLAAYGTGVYPLLAHATDTRRGDAFLLGALGLLVLGRATRPPVRLALFATATAASLWFAMRGPLESAGFEEALFGSRGLVFRTPLLWAAVAGLAVLVRREGRNAAPIAVVGLLAFALAPFTGGAALDASLPALCVGLATGLDALCRLLARRPAWALAPAMPLLALSNLLFMEQYRYTLKRDDTVSFPQVSEGNARLVSNAVGSPIAWPANWIWSARTGVPVERWDLLSGQRFRLGDSIDVGDLDQDAAFLLEGWSVRHACGAEIARVDAICRQVEGRAELVVPMEREVTGDLYVYVRGSGALRVSVNGEVVDTIRVQPDPSIVIGAPRCQWRRGVNRVVLESLGGVQLVDGLEVRSIREPAF